MDPVFWELHSGFAREGPGSPEDTLRALALTGLGGAIDVLDLGCGPGASALVLLEALPEARVTGLDLHRPFLETARAACESAGCSARFAPVEADMADPPFPAGSFDLLWSEGAAYSIGLARALEVWRPLLRPGGRIAFSDAVWLSDRPAQRTRDFWADYPELGDRAAVRAIVRGAGYALIGDHVLSHAAWQNYYGPHAARLDVLEARHGAEHPVLAAAREEIAVRAAHGDEYGYAFFVAGLP